MPMMMGFAQHRMGLLQQELDKIVEMLPQLGIRRCILLNPLYPGAVERDTSLKLVMIMDDDRPFVRRPDFFYSHLSPRVAVEFLAYTPQELETIENGDSYLSKAIKRGEVIYDG